MDILGTCRELENRIAALETRIARQGAILGASGNYWSMPGVSGIHSQTGTNGGAVCLAGIVLFPQFTGLFRVDAALSFAGDTNAKKYQVQVVSCVGGSGVFAGGTVQGFGGSQIVPPSLVNLPAGTPGGRILNADAAGTAATGLQFSGGAFLAGQVLQKDKQGVTLTGLLAAPPANIGIEEFAAGGIMGSTAPTTVKAPYALNVPVAFGLLFTDLSTGTEVWSFDSLNFSVQEMISL